MNKKFRILLSAAHCASCLWSGYAAAANVAHADSYNRDRGPVSVIGLRLHAEF
jgi:hypothetical protein